MTHWEKEKGKEVKEARGVGGSAALETKTVLVSHPGSIDAAHSGGWPIRAWPFDISAKTGLGGRREGDTERVDQWRV